MGSHYLGRAAKYNLMAGDVVRVGKHRFYCGDAVRLFRSGRWDQVFGERSSFAMTDPPWNQAVFNQFYRLAEQPADSLFTNFVQGCAELLAYQVRGTMVVWFGKAQWPVMLQALTNAGIPTVGTASAFYGPASKPTEMVVWVGGQYDGPVVDIPDGLPETSLLNWLARMYVQPDMTVFDPCCGRLFTGGPFIKAGGIMHGCELIPDKLALGLARLSDKTGQAVVKEDHLDD